jgi:hypothetical protein
MDYIFYFFLIFCFETTPSRQEEAMVAPCGHSFSRESIERWVRDDAKHFCPLCRQALTLDQLHPNFSLRDAVEKCALLYSLIIGISL